MKLVPLKQRGFTIIELLIATTIISVILVTVTILMISIGNLYYKGITQSRTQDSMRAIADDIALSVQLNGGGVVAGSGQAICVGVTRYTPTLYVKVSGTQGLWRDKLTATGGCATEPLHPEGRQLVAPKSRLTDFFVSSTSPYTIRVALAYGDDDLLCDKNRAGECAIRTGTTSPWMAGILSGSTPGINIRCKGGTGSQFCGAASLKITVVQRLISG